MVVMDENDQLWAMSVRIPAPQTRTRFIRTTRTMAAEERQAYREFHLRIGPEAARSESGIHNRLVVYTSGRRFVRKVEAEGSRDGRHWTLLATGYVLDLEGRVNRRILSYADSDVPAVRVRVYPDPKKQQDRFTVLDASLFHREEEAVEVEPVALEARVERQSETKPRAQILLFDARAKNRPIESVALDVRDKAFVRAVRVYGRNAGGDRWRWVGERIIYRLARQEHLRFPLQRFAYRYMKLEIPYGAEGPLTVDGVRAEAFVRYLVVEAGSGSSPALYYGAEVLSRVAPPYVEAPRATAPESRLQPRVRLSDRSPVGEPKEEDMPQWVAVAVVAGAAVLFASVGAGWALYARRKLPPLFRQ